MFSISMLPGAQGGPYWRQCLRAPDIKKQTNHLKQLGLTINNQLSPYAQFR